MSDITLKQYSTIKQANAMIHGRQSMNLMAKRLLILGGSKIDVHSDRPNEVRIHFEEYAEFSSTRVLSNWKGKWQLLSKIFQNLKDNPLMLGFTAQTVDQASYESHDWLKSLVIDIPNREIVLVYTDKIRQFFTYSKGQTYTNTCDGIGGYRSMYTIRIKEFIESEKFKKQAYFEIPLEQLKWQLGLEKKYPRFYDFRARILEAAQKELKKKESPVQFRFKTLGKRGKVVQRGVELIRFYPQFIGAFNSKEQADTAPALSVNAVPKAASPSPINQEYLSKYPSVVKTLKGWGISAVNINQQIKQKGIELVKKAIEVAVAGKNVNSHSGLYISALNKDWTTEKIIKKQTTQAAKQRQAARAKQEKQREQLKNAIDSEDRARINRIVEQLVAQDKSLIETAYQQYRQGEQDKGGSRMLKMIPTTAKATYASNYRWVILGEIQNMFPEQFAFTLTDWPKERPLQYKDLLNRVTSHYQVEFKDSPTELAHHIEATMSRTFHKFYGKKMET